MKKLIVKVQVPLYSSDGNAGILVYDKNREIMTELSLRTRKERCELLRVLGGEPKGYFYAKMEDKELILMGVAPWQNW